MKNPRTTPRRPSASLTLFTALAAAGALQTAPVAMADIAAPTNLAGHVLWLDGSDFDGDGMPDAFAHGATLTTWVDKSGGLGDNSVTVTNGAPTVALGAINGLAAARFVAGSEDKLDNAGFVVADNYTVYTVVSGGGGHVLSGIATDSTDAVLYNTGGGFRFYSGVTTGGVDHLISGINSRPHMVGYRIDAGGIDSGFHDSVISLREWSGPATLSGIRIGNLDRDTPSSTVRPEAWGGDIAEVIVYDRALSNAEHTDVSRYLAGKYGLQISLSTGALTEIETGQVTGGTPSTLLPTSIPVAAGQINVAHSENGGLAFAKDHIGPGSERDFRPWRANDGFYSDPPEGAPPIQEPWIGATLESWIGVRLDAPSPIDKIGFETQFPNRRDGAYMIEYTLDDFSGIAANADLGLDPTGVDGLNWELIDVVQIADDALGAGDTRHLYGFSRVDDVTGVRIRIQSGIAEVALSEIEVWAIPEPSAIAFLVSGALGFAFVRRRGHRMR
ncbi:MAG TPA: hypothetical protein VMN39_11700 [Longimicrobiaceae bacterium]|nr:hypothetical protein [Longimicrobiaceae bacterium]